MPDRPRTAAAARIVLSRLPRAAPTAFDLAPDTDARTALADALELSALRKLRLAGELIPEGKRDWRLEATLGATVTQPCVVTLEPVTTRIDTTVTRRYLADWAEPEGDEAEMPEDDSAEPLPVAIEPAAILAEALALAVPDYPRADGVDPLDAAAAPPGVAPLDDDAVKPLSGLAALRERLTGGSGDDGSD